MSQFGAIYLSFDKCLIEKVDLFSATLKQQGYLFTVRYYHEKPWVQLHVDEPEATPYLAQAVSKIFPTRRVVGLAAYTASDSVLFCQFSDGAVVRLLQSGFEKERQWDKIEGEAQQWEPEILNDLTIEVGSPGMMTDTIRKIGKFLDMAGFGLPGYGEAWNREIIN